MPSAHVGEAARPRAATLARYFLGSYIAVAITSAPYLRHSWSNGVVAGFYGVSMLLTYSALYLLPALLVTAVTYLLLRGDRRWMRVPTTRSLAIYTCAIGTVTLVEFALLVDGIVMREFGFHLNAFVLNLVVTPGGIESMGLGETLAWTCGVAIFGLLAIQSTILWAAQSPRFELLWPRRSWYLRALLTLVFVSAAEHLTYIVRDLRSDTTLFEQANAFPLYRPITARKIARRWGFEVGRVAELGRLTEDDSPLDYPRRPIEFETPAHRLNVLWLVSESLRFDALTPEIMPATWALSERAWSFRQHFSGANGTRMGVFSMFYGLHGPYWFSFLNERRSPVMIDVLLEQDYQIRAYTSARFSYPEFDRTVFTRVADRNLHDSHDSYYSKSLDKGWMNDRQHVGEIVDFMRTRDRSRPFFVYMFFESTHYRYYFPRETAVREPYLQDMSHAALGVGDDPELLHNRYLNGAHYVDMQIQRVLDVLEEMGDFDDTIVIVTGDHGEEFMEKGRRGHNSDFHDEQVHVPLVLKIPGSSPRRINEMTSHVDIAPTLLPLLGVTNLPEDYSLGIDLRSSAVRKDVVVADWSRIGIIDHDYKLTVPIGGSGILEKAEFTTHDDAPIGDPARAFRAVRPELADVMSDLHRFRLGDRRRPRVLAGSPHERADGSGDD